MTHARNVVLAVLATAVLATAVLAGVMRAAVADERSYHAPQTGAEKALDDILRQAGNDPDMLDYLLDARGKGAAHPVAKYDAMVTAALRQAIQQVQAKLVRETCHGASQDEPCGLDFDPILCAQDVADRYLYRTVAETPRQSEIVYAWPGQGAAPAEPGATFRLLKSGDAWRIDGVRCADGTEFNGIGLSKP
jgi:hypothetical protein